MHVSVSIESSLDARSRFGTRQIAREDLVRSVVESRLMFGSEQYRKTEDPARRSILGGHDRTKQARRGI